jgi:hypothetical protein
VSPSTEFGDNFGQVVPLIGLSLGLARAQYVERPATIAGDGYGVPRVR